MASQSGLVTFTLKVNGTTIDDDCIVQSIKTFSEVNKVDRAQIRLFDGKAAKSTFALSEGNDFVPGNKLSISVGYDTKEQEIFSGVVVKHGIEINGDDGSALVVELRGEAFKMTLGRHNALFEKVKDSALMASLITANGLKKDVSATTRVLDEVVQYFCSDWDLMVMRAQLNSMVVIAQNDSVKVAKPDTAQGAVLSVKYGDSITDLQLDMDAAHQYNPAVVKSHSWDSSKQQWLESGPGTVKVEEPGNLSSKKLAEVFKLKNFTQQSAAPLDKAALKDWSSAQVLWSVLAKIRGSVEFRGDAKAQTGKVIELQGLGERFNGKAYISGVQHSVCCGQWLTRVEVGLSDQWFGAATPDISAVGAGGQLPAVSGLQTGIVKQLDQDPNGEFRVLVSLPLLQDDSKGVWVRLANFYASNKFGELFYPELKDEVIIGFLNDDPNSGVILGSLYSKKLPPPFPVDKDNNTKAIKTRSGLTLLFDEKDKVIELLTPDKQHLRIDDKGKSILIEDNNKNTIELSASGIKLQSDGDIDIKAKGNISLKAGGKLKMEAATTTSLEATEITCKASGKFTAKGNAGASVEASGILTLKGAMVKIN